LTEERGGRGKEEIIDIINQEKERERGLLVVIKIILTTVAPKKLQK